VSTPGQKKAGQRLRQALSAYREAEDLIQLGAYVSGSNAVLDASVKLRPELIDFLRQEQGEVAPHPSTLARMEELAKHLETASVGHPEPAKRK
jgi:flagellar biosynthesis/type III secretory pathway ATPase